MTQIKLRRDTSSAFASSNPVLGNGEPAYETDTKKLKIGDGTTAYTQLEYFSAGGGSSTDITASLPLKIVDGVISLEVDGQTIQVVDGKLHANLDELGNEVNSLTGEVTDLSGRVTAVEADILSKQDKFTTASPLDIKNVASVSLRDVTISGDNLLFGNNNLLTGQVSVSISTSSTFAQSIQTGIVIPYKFGQVLQFHCGNDTYVQGSNSRHGSPCVALFGHFSGSGDFVTALAINGFASYVSLDVRGNMGGALKAGAASMLPNRTYQTTTGERSVERGENTINMGTDYSTYIQLMVNDAGNLMQGIYGHYGTNSNDVGWGAMARTDVIQDRSLDSGQKVADIIAAIDTAVIIKGSDFGTIKKANFGLYDYNERLPWTQAGYDTFMANKGDNLIDLDNPSIKPQLQLNIGDGLSITAGKLTATGGSAPENMVTTDTTQEITGAKSFKNTITAYSPFSFDCREGNARLDVVFKKKDTGAITTAPLMNFNLDKFSDTIEFGVANSNLKLIGNVKDGSSNKFLTSGNISDYLPTATSSSKGVVKPDGTSITVSSDGTISATAAGGGDVTLAGDNTFTGTNLFTKDTLFDGVTTFNGDTWIDRLQIGTILTNEQGKKFLAQGNVTAGDNITITETTDGIQISATGSSPEVYVNGNSGYIKYPNGYYEEWGFVPSGSGANTEITFMNTMADTNYNIVGGVQGTAGSSSTMTISSGLIIADGTKRTTGFSTYRSTVAGKYWKISGKLKS